MANFIKINDFSAPELDLFARLTGAQLRSRLEPEKGVFIAESPEVIKTALNSGVEPVALLTDEKLINGAVKEIISKLPDGVPVYLATRDVLSKLTGFALTRGAICAMKRPKMQTLDDILAVSKRVAVLEEIADSTNIGAIFRSAAALGIDAVLITPTCCDPLCRRAVRVSMGTVFQVPWTKIGGSASDWPRIGIDKLKEAGFKTLAMALSDDSIGIDSPVLNNDERLAVILGTEGNGLKKETISLSDYTVKIPMSHGVDSLNVACAATVAFWELRRRG